MTGALRHALDRLVCRGVGHETRWSLAIALGVPGPICARCGKKLGR